MSSSGNGSTGLPRRSLGRLPSLAPLSDWGAAGRSAGLPSLAFASPGLDSVGGDDAGEPSGPGLAGVDPVVPPGACEGAAAGVVLAGVVSFGVLRVKRGGSSLVSIPTGTVSAVKVVFGFSVPAGSHMPVPIHGLWTLTALLCSALLTVNRPKELPARSASYTVPGSNAIGTGSALYALASQNFPPIRIATGTSVALRLAASWSTPTARGPASFFLEGFRSPGVICGRSSCAATTAHDPTQASSATKKHPRYKIFWKATLADAAFSALKFNCPGEIPMKVNDKAPDFTLQDQNEREVALKDLRGKTVVLYFFPRADTPG